MRRHPTSPNRGRGRGDAGVALVETALAMPLVFSCIMMLFDFSLVELKQAQISSAARDGARTGIISWLDADQATYTGSSCTSNYPAFTTICSATLSRVAGAKVDTISVRCYATQTTTVLPCREKTNTVSGLTHGLDTLVVTVTYSYKAATPIGQIFLGKTKQFTSSSRMVVS